MNSDEFVASDECSLFMVRYKFLHIGEVAENNPFDIKRNRNKNAEIAYMCWLSAGF